MTISIVLTKTGFDASADSVLFSNMMLFANSAEQVLNDFANGAQASDQHLFTGAQTLQINGGIIAAPSQKLVIVSAEISTTDNLTTIGVSNNRGIVLKAAAGQIITVQPGLGNIETQDSSNVVLSGNIAIELWCIGSQWSVIGPGSAGVEVINNYTGIVVPTPTEDAGDGYSVGSLWINTVDNSAYINTLNSTNLAKWPRITPYRNEWSIKGGGTSILGVGVPDPTVLNALTTGNDGLDLYALMASTAVANQLAGFTTTTFNLVRPSHDPVIEIFIKTGSDLTTLRYWLGIVDAAITSVDTLAAGREFIGWRYSSVTGDTGWRPILHDGTTQNTGTAIGTIAVSSSYLLKMRIDSANSRVFFSVNGSAETMLNANFPLLSTEMGLIARLIPTAAVIRNLSFGYVKVSW